MSMKKESIIIQIITIILITSSVFYPFLLCLTIPFCVITIGLLYEKIKYKNELLDVMYMCSSKSIVGQACLSKSLNELTRQNEKIDVFKRLNKWLVLREELLSNLNNECESKGNQNLKSVYGYALDISSKIHSGEIDINRN